MAGRIESSLHLASQPAGLFIVSAVMAKIKVSIYEDNNGLRESLCRLIATHADFLLAGAHPNANGVIENTAKEQPDVILMDIDMPGLSGIEAVAQVKSH